MLAIAMGIIGTIGVIGGVTSFIPGRGKPVQPAGDSVAGEALLQQLIIRKKLSEETMIRTLTEYDSSRELKNIACIRYDLAVLSLARVSYAKARKWVINKQAIEKAQKELDLWYLENDLTDSRNQIVYEAKIETLMYMKKGLM